MQLELYFHRKLSRASVALSLAPEAFLRGTACALAFTFCCGSANAQSDAKSKELLQTGLQALGSLNVNDVMLTSTASFGGGSSASAVPASLQAQSSGSIAITYQTPSGPQAETHIVGNNGIWSGAWKDTKGALHPLAQHNMMTEPTWFFPLFAIERSLNSTGPQLQVSYVGAETFRGGATQHLRVIATASPSVLMRKLSQTDLYLDAVTLLPTAFVYNDHPDGNALVDIPVTVLFSDYSTLRGTLLPTHVQQLRNNAVFVDLHIQDIQVNTHLSISPLQ